MNKCKWTQICIAFTTCENRGCCSTPSAPTSCAPAHYFTFMWGSGLRAASTLLAGSILRTSEQTGRGSLGDVPRDGLCRDAYVCTCVDGGLREVLNHRHTAVEAADGSLRFCVNHTHVHTQTQIHSCKNILPCDTFCQIRHKVGHFCSTDLHWLMPNLCLSLSLTLFNTLTQAEQPENSAFKKQMDQ